MKIPFAPLLLAISFFFSLHLIAQAPPIEWKKTFGGTSDEVGMSLKETTAGNFIIAGYSNSNNGDVTGHHGTSAYKDYWILLLDAEGGLLWQKSLGGTADDGAYSLCTTDDGGYVACGYAMSNDGNVSGNHGYTDAWIVKLNAAGGLVWQKCFGGTGGDDAFSVKQTIDHGYIAVGSSSSTNGDVASNNGASDYLIIKLDSTGDLLWEKNYGGSGYDYATSVEQTSDSGYIVSGYSNSDDVDVTGNHGDYDYWVLKLDSLGELQWQKSYGGSLAELNGSTHQTLDLGYIISGFSATDIGADGDVSISHGLNDYWIVKTDPNGNIEWEKTYGGGYNDYGRDAVELPNNGYLVTGYSTSDDGDVSAHFGTSIYSDFWTLKIDAAGAIEWEQNYGGTNWDYAQVIEQTNDLGIIMCGGTESNDFDVTGLHGAADVWVVKLACAKKTYYADMDADSFGDAAAGVDECVAPPGYVLDSSDCDDTNPLIYPGAPEIADGADNNCNDTIDEGLDFIISPVDFSSLNIFPNPASDHCTISLQENAVFAQQVTISVVNIFGDIILNKTTAIQTGTLKERISLENIPAGIYMIKIFDGNTQFSKKLIIE